jgi:integrase
MDPPTPRPGRRDHPAPAGAAPQRDPRGRGSAAGARSAARGRLLAHADSNRVSTRHGFRAYVALCAFADLRKGEAAGVQAGDIDLTLRRLTVSRQLQRDGSTFVARLPKYGSERVVHLPDELVEISAFTSRCSCPRNRHRTRGCSPWATGRCTTTTSTGGGGRRGPRPDCRTCGSTTFRHFYASGLIAAGCDVVTVHRSLGHSSATTTLNGYSHLWPTAEDRTRAAAAGLMTEALRTPCQEGRSL